MRKMSMLNQRFWVVPASLLAMINAALPAEGSGLEVVPVDNTSGGPALANFRTFDIYLDESGPDWIGAETILSLSNGSLYQDPAGGPAVPDPVDFVAHPSLEFDTYVGIVGDATTSVDGPATMLGGGPMMRFDTTRLDVRWSNTADETGLNQIPLMRVSLSDDATGEWNFIAAREGEEVQGDFIVIFDGRATNFYGDLNSDLFVGQDDLNIVLAHWGQFVPFGDRSQGDPSGDGFVGQDDVTTVLGGWGQGTPPAITAFNPVPEPQSNSLVIAAVVLLLPFHRTATNDSTRSAGRSPP